MPYLSPQVTIPDNESIYCSACGNPCVGHYHTVNLEYRGYDHTAYYCTNCFEVITDYDYYLMQLDFEMAADSCTCGPGEYDCGKPYCRGYGSPEE